MTVDDLATADQDHRNAGRPRDGVNRRQTCVRGEQYSRPSGESMSGNPRLHIAGCLTLPFQHPRDNVFAVEPHRTIAAAEQYRPAEFLGVRAVVLPGLDSGERWLKSRWGGTSISSARRYWLMPMGFRNSSNDSTCRPDANTGSSISDRSGDQG